MDNTKGLPQEVLDWLYDVPEDIIIDKRRIKMEKKRNVMCAMCQFEVAKICSKNKIGVSIKKKRSCAFYQEDESKVSVMVARRLTAPKPEVSFRPDWYWDRAERRRLMKEAQRQEEEKKANSVFTGDPAHPLTGDLSRFVKSTVGE
jgi:hypothetical protein